MLYACFQGRCITITFFPSDLPPQLQGHTTPPYETSTGHTHMKISFALTLSLFTLNAIIIMLVQVYNFACINNPCIIYLLKIHCMIITHLAVYMLGVESKPHPPHGVFLRMQCMQETQLDIYTSTLCAIQHPLFTKGSRN